MKIAGLDLGSNTIKITVAETDGKELHVLGETARITRIGQGLDQNTALLPEAIERTIAGLKELVRFANERGATKIGCVGTAGLRGAANAGEFLARAKKECDLDVEVIDGLREAELAFKAPALAYGPGPIIVTDIGGRSTEVVSGSAAGISGRVSLEIGSVRLTERFLPSDPPTPEERRALAKFLPEALSTAPPAPARGSKLIGVSGTVVSLIGLQLDVDEMEDAVEKGEGTPLRRDRLSEILEDLAKKPTKERIRGTVLPAGRADVIVAGAMIVLGLMDHYGETEMIASNRGVRYGVLYELACT